MSRDLTGSVVTELSASRVRVANLLEVEFSTGYVRLWTGVGTLTWDSKSWTGAGDFLQFHGGAETVAVQANGMTITLNGINSALISAALGNARQNKPCKIWLAFLDASENVISDPVLFFSGRVDTMEIVEGADTSTIVLQAESRLVDLTRSKLRRFTHEDQKLDYPLDQGFEYVSGIQNWNGQWGAGPPSIGIPHKQFEFNPPDISESGEGDYGDSDYGGGPGGETDLA